MGHRANLVIASPTSYELFYSHWCASHLPFLLFWGPNHAEEYIRLQRPIDNDEWMDTVWAEGGAVLDRSRRRLLMFGDDVLGYDLPLRRVFLQMMHAVWNEWSITWAHEGIVDIAEYVGVPRERVIAYSDGDKRPLPVTPSPKQTNRVGCIASVETTCETRFYPLGSLVERYVSSGVELLPRLQGQESYSHFEVTERTEDFPGGGFHVNVDDKTLAFWSAHECPNILPIVQGTWPGWHVTWQYDDFEAHATMTRGALRFNIPPLGTLLETLIELFKIDTKPVDVLSTAKVLAERFGGSVGINPLALRDDRLPIAEKDRVEILAHAIAQIKAGERRGE